MVTLSKRLEALRSERALSQPSLSLALGMPKNTVEKIESGRMTPNKEQVKKIADFFGVSVQYLQGESDDPATMQTWMDTARSEPEPERQVRPVKTRPAVKTEGSVSVGGSFLESESFQQTLKKAILEVLKSPEGQEILRQAVRKEINHLK